VYPNAQNVLRNPKIRPNRVRYSPASLLTYKTHVSVQTEIWCDDIKWPIT
jgi:hypothetical protein